MSVLRRLMNAFGLFLALCCAKLYAESVTNCSVLTATGNSEYPPFLWRDAAEPNQLQGSNRLIIDELSRRIKMPILLQHVGPWSRAQSEVKTGRVDIMAGVFYTRHRADYMDYFTPVLLHTKSVVWQRKSAAFAYHGKEDLIGHWGVTVINNSFGEEFDRFATEQLNILTVASLSQALKMLASNKVDYALYEMRPAQAYASLLRVDDQLAAVEPHISSEGLYLTLSKASPCNTSFIRHQIAIALQDMSQGGFMEQALQQGMEDWQSSSSQSLLIKD
ncbi:transporter substrate-binding domain-containing protein [Marinomonas sp. THO17]|uniref:substrate-binding periplasmic protein n=1 Tax=Marinomonas sp. THO17 TaxID=3149048 RepID=UPI00336BF5FF